MRDKFNAKVGSPSFSLRGGQTGTLTTRPDAVFGHRVTNCTTILELREYD